MIVMPVSPYVSCKKSDPVIANDYVCIDITFTVYSSLNEDNL
jgi:hypothetical protein